MPQGIFISYRRKDSPSLVTVVYHALKAAFPRKKIFFDLDVPAPGNELIEKIEREMESSQVVLTIIGRQWNAANRLDDEHDYVRHELKHALVLKAKRKLQILPVLVDGAAMPKGGLPPDIAAIEQLEYLEIAQENPLQRIVEEIKRLLPSYWIGSSEDIVRWRWNWVDLLKKLIRLDINEVPTIDTKPENPLRRLQFESHRLFENLGLRAKDPGDEGTPEQWALIFERHPQTWRLILDREDDIVAYWHVAPLKTEHYSKLIAGRFKAGMVTYDKLTMFEKKAGTYDLFFVIMVVDEHHRNTALYRQLYFSFFEVLDRLAAADEPIFVREVAADVWTSEGMKLAEGFNMVRVGQRADNPRVLIYSAPISRILSDYMAKREYPDLRKRYQAAGFALDERPGTGS